MTQPSFPLRLHTSLTHAIAQLQINQEERASTTRSVTSPTGSELAPYTGKSHPGLAAASQRHTEHTAQLSPKGPAPSAKCVALLSQLSAGLTPKFKK